MFDKLIDVILSFINLFYVITIVAEYERAVVLRWGKYHRTLDPGRHWILPLSIETVLSDNITPTTTVLPTQSLTTKDGKAVALTSIVTWRITDIKKLLLEVEGGEAIVMDTVSGEVARAVAARQWESVQQSRFARDTQARCRELSEEFGVYIDKLQFRDIALCRSYRLFNGGI